MADHSKHSVGEFLDKDKTRYVKKKKKKNKLSADVLGSGMASGAAVKAIKRNQTLKGI